jgi:hypothetical protein
MVNPRTVSARRQARTNCVTAPAQDQRPHQLVLDPAAGAFDVRQRGEKERAAAEDALGC